MTFEIADLRERPEFFDAVADRIWRAWWERRGVELAAIRARLMENLRDASLPIAFVAHEAGAFRGTASLIASDSDEWPDYTPWVAAVWTEPEARGGGIARTLIARACAAGFALGHPRIYLAAAPNRRSYYAALDWTPLEEIVGPRQLTVFCRDSAD